MVSPIDVTRIPKTDLHLHAESSARFDRLQAREDGRRPYDWRN